MFTLYTIVKNKTMFRFQMCVCLKYSCSENMSIEMLIFSFKFMSFCQELSCSQIEFLKHNTIL